MLESIAHFAQDCQFNMLLHLIGFNKIMQSWMFSLLLISGRHLYESIAWRSPLPSECWKELLEPLAVEFLNATMIFSFHKISTLRPVTYPHYKDEVLYFYWLFSDDVHMTRNRSECDLQSCEATEAVAASAFFLGLLLHFHFYGCFQLHRVWFL